MQEWLDVGGGIRVTGSGAAWLPSDRTVVLADVHVGYELAARRRGGYLPRIERGADIGARLVGLVTSLGATRLVIAGDLRHSTRDVDAMERAELAALASVVRASIALDVVRGNHDRDDALIGGESALMIRVGDVDVMHHPPANAPERWTICGHLHPRVTLRDETGASERFACALVGDRTVIVPAFSEWAGGTEARRLLPSLYAGPWRVLPTTGTRIADVGLVLTRASG